MTRALRLFTGLAVTAAILVPVAPGVAAGPSPAPKPKISVSPKTLRQAKYKQDTMIKRSQRHPEATSGTTAGSENPHNPPARPTTPP